MKLNNKGFAISSIMYIILILAVILISVTLAILSSRKLILDKLRKETTDNIYGISYNSVINTLKHEAISYATRNNVNQENIRIGDFETSVSQDLLEHHELTDKYLTLFKNNYNYDVYLGQTKKVTDISKPIENMIGIADYKIEGNSYQQTYTGKNLFDVNSCTSDGNGYIRISTEHLEIGKTYTISSKTPFNWFKLSNSTTGYNSDYVRGDLTTYTFTMQRNENIAETATQYIFLSFGEVQEFSKDINDFINANIQIEEGTKATSYEPYVGGISSPNPAYPQEIQSVGDKTKNLFDMSIYKNSINQYGITVTYLEDEDTILLNGTAEATAGFGSTYINIPIINGSYFSISTEYVSGKVNRPNDSDYAVAYFGAGDTINTSTNWRTIHLYEQNGKAENIQCNYNYISRFWFYITEGVTFDNYKVRIQLEEGTKSTEYEPYGYKIPVKVSGKNLYDLNSIIIDGGILEENTIISNKKTTNIDLYLKKGTYSIKFNKQDIENVFLREGQVSSGFFKQVTGDETSTFTFEEDEYLRISYFSGGKLLDIMLVEGTYTNEMMPNYEPYVEPVTTNIYLDEPLRKIEDYRDSLEFGASKEVRKIRNGKIEKLTTYIPSKKSSVCWFTMNNNGLKEQIPDSVVQSPIFKSLQEIWWQDKEGIISHKTNSKGTYFSLSWRRLGLIFDGTNVYSEEDVEKTTPLNDTDLYNIGDEYVINKLSEDKKNIYYQLNTPIEEDLILPKINMNNGQSNIEINTTIQPSSVEFTIIEKIRKL